MPTSAARSLPSLNWIPPRYHPSHFAAPPPPQPYIPYTAKAGTVTGTATPSTVLIWPSWQQQTQFGVSVVCQCRRGFRTPLWAVNHDYFLYEGGPNTAPHSPPHFMHLFKQSVTKNGFNPTSKHQCPLLYLIYFLAPGQKEVIWAILPVAALWKSVRLFLSLCSFPTALQV